MTTPVQVLAITDPTDS